MNRYRNFVVEVFGYRQDAGREFSSCRVLDSPDGGQRDSESTETEFPAALRQRLQRLETRDLDADELIGLGEGLASLLLPSPVREFYWRSLAKLKDTEGLRIQIRPDSAEISALPWEYIYIAPRSFRAARKGAEGFLALDRRISIVRHEVTGEATPSIEPLRRQDLGLVALLADIEEPGYAPLDLDREELNLRDALEGIAKIEARIVRPGTIGQFEEALSKGAQIFHFAGHGEVKREMGERLGSIEAQGRLILPRDDGQPGLWAFEAGTLARNLRGHDVRLVVLAACESALGDRLDPWNGVASALVREGIPAVVGMQQRLGDASAIAFGHRFYTALAQGKSIDASLADGRLAVYNRSGLAERDWGAPVLYLRSDRSHLFPPSPRSFRVNLFLLFASFVLLAVWFFFHLFPWLEATLSKLVQGAGLGAASAALLFAAWKLAGSVLARLTGANDTVVLERTLRDRRATSFLAPLACLALILFVSTGSVYLSMEPGDQPAESVEVRLTRTADGTAFGPYPSLRVTSESVLAGGPYFAMPCQSLKVSIDAPAGWELARDTVLEPCPWRSAVLRFSQDFAESRLRLLRLVPRSNLISILPKVCPPGGECPAPTDSFSLRVTIPGNPAPFELPDLRQGVVYIGAVKRAIETRLDRETLDQQRISLAKCFGPDPDDELMDTWLAGRQFLATPQLQEGDSLTVEVYRDDHGEAPILKKTIEAAGLDQGTINTRCLSRGIP